MPALTPRRHTVRNPLHHFAAIAILLGATLPALAADAPAPPAVAGTSADPVADPRAVVIFGKARFTVLTSQLIRMEWAADGKFEDHASLVFLNRRLPVPKIEKTISDDKNRLTLKTAALTLVYTTKPGDDGRFNPENLAINLDTGDKLTIWRPGMVDEQNLMGTTRTLDGAIGDKTHEPIEPGLVSRSGWALVDDSTRPLFDSADFSFRQGENSPWPWVMERPAGERQDWYFFGYGLGFKKALGDYVRVAGRIPLPPRFAFGAWWSRYWAYSDQEVEEIVRGFHENDTPLDVFVIDMDWHLNYEQLKAEGQTDQSNHRLGWTGYTWNKFLFPDPDKFLTRLHADGLKTSLNLHPASGIQPFEDHYPEMARAMGIDPSTKRYVPFDITDKKFTTNYFNLILHPLEKQGIDFWWLDWQQEKTTKMEGVNPTWWLNYVHFTDQQREGKRPLLFHRWGGLGNHRYQIGFSGDTVSVWPSLAFQPWFTATAANVGYAYWSHDIGGHMPGAVDPELFTRWVEFGAFSPILRTHTTKNPDSERRIWAYPEPFSSILRATFQLRYALQPYIYTEARRTYDTGVGFLHPLYYDWPTDSHTYAFKGEYAYGEQMLVAPVVTPTDKATGLAEQDVYLPQGDWPGGGWIEWPTGKHLAGGGTAHRSFSIDQTPVYLKEGAIVPMQPPMSHTGQRAVDPLIVNVWPLAPGSSSTYEVYEDSGASIDYQRGVFVRTPIKATQAADTLRLEILPAEGSYPGMLRTRSYELRLPADWPPDRVTVNAVPVPQAGPTGKGGWTFEGNTLTTVIPVPAAPVEARVAIEVHRAVGLTGRRSELDGFPGAMTRLRAAYDAMNQTHPVSTPPDPLIDAMQSGDRLGYHPEKAVDELAHYRAVLPQAIAALDDIAKDFPERVEKTAKQVVNGIQPPADLEALKQRRLDLMARAQKLAAEAGK
jgi:alpha-glucosidase (family GH31 glycosyl hydrolase)